jgi:soluble lytic murein transglycosylase-like protein
MMINFQKICYIVLLFFLTSYGWAVLAETVDTDSRSVIVYKYIDERGVLHLTNKPPHKRDNMLYSRSYLIQSYQPEPPPTYLNGGTLPLMQIPLSAAKKPKIAKAQRKTSYHSLIDSAATRHRLSPALLHAVIDAESAYNPNAVSPKGAVGLMQLMPGTASRYGVSDRTDPAENIEGGARYLRDLLTLFNENLSLAVAAYNAGENAVARYDNKIPPYAETKNYVQQVLNLYQQYLVE